MVTKVLLSKQVVNDFKRLPLHIVRKLQTWKIGVETLGLEEMRKRPGFHDEPLRGDRRGQRSIRLSNSYRAIYRVVEDKIIFVLVEEVSKHDY